ncbi:response regulator [Phormidium sp. FACHB-592]|uniref:histidine kinase n=1 Tax=Stenomitos frigidus AS-A4 TaxID=2933935 RepID=A0ABV0KJU0_9CYAN|nr:ATP-binding protein [Phormidium sp. FACHB-592]MBD2073537.1 response regulator [Phormidium sp. FACHB-592]
MNGQRTDPFPKFGEMGLRMQALNWAETPAGAVESWSQSLKSTVRTLLSSRYPMILLWEQELIQLYNDAYINLIGTKHPYALGRSIRETQAESWDVIGPMITEVMTTGVPNWVEDQMLAVNRSGYNEEAHFSLSYSAVEDDTGVVRGMLCVCSEVTKQVLGERGLRLQRDLAARAGETRSVDVTCQDILAAIAEYPLDVPFALIYLRDGDNQMRLCGSVRLDGNQALVPTTVLLADATDRWSLAEAMTGQIAIIESLHHDLTIPGGPWNETVQQAIALPIPSSNMSAPLGVLICGISPNRALDEGYQSFYELLAGQVSVSIRNAQAYEEERHRAEKLAEIDRAKTVFFSNVSHEFRTPLTLMLNPLEEALQSGNLPAAEQEQITVAHRNSQRLLKLVNTLLDFSRIEAGRTQAVYEPVDLASLTADLASVFRAAIEKAGLQLVVDCPPLAEPVYVDRQMWEKIVLNLLSNAFKFTFTGQISVSLHPVEDAVELVVKDTGTGIPAHELPRLFERFHRVAEAQGRSYEGSGIGLSLVQELVNLHNGTVTVSSVVESGSTFVVRLPMGYAHLPSEQIQVSQTQTATASSATAYVEEALGWVVEPKEDPAALPQRASARILLADDNADMRHYLQRLLRAQYDVEAVANGQAALEAARIQMPDLVLTDVMMPQVDGFELLRQLRLDPQTREIPILLLSARAGEEAAIEGLEAGADDYLVKPFSARELLARVATNLELGRSRQAANQQRFRFLAESIPQMVWTADAEGRVDYYSPRWFDYTGLTLAQSQGSGWQDVIHPDDRASNIEAWTQAVEKGVSYDIEQRLRRADGSYRWHLTRALPMLDEQSQVIRWFGTCTDITDRKQAETAREQLLQQEKAAREAAEQANRLKDEFLAVLSHELRSPLNPILGWAKLLSSGRLDAVRTREAINTIERNAQLQSQLIEDLLDISRIMQGKLTLKATPVSLPFVVSTAIETVRLAAEAKAIQIKTSFELTVNQIYGDAGRLQQVVWNLLSNAVKFTPPGGRVEVRLEEIRHGESKTQKRENPSHSPLLTPYAPTYARITVTDTGKGISPKFLPYVFEHFRQEDGAITRKFGGLGLGMAIARQIVELHGGKIWVESLGEDQGTTFIVELPLLSDEGARKWGSEETQHSGTSSSHYPLSGLRVLVVDDDLDSRAFVTFVVEQAGAEVTAVGSAIEALQALQTTPFDLLLSDIGMPEMDGYALMQQIRAMLSEQGKDIVAIALTAYAGEFNQEKALSAGFQHHVSKPVEPERLIRAIVTLLSQANSTV